MKAILQSKYGPPDVLVINEMEAPIPKKGQVLVKVHAASINYSNVALLRGKPFLVRFVFGLSKPKFSIPGGDMAGVVEAVGHDVTQFQAGDAVYADLSGCGWGAYAEYVCVPETALVRKPANLSFEEAAAVPMAATTALQALRDKGNVQPGQKVLVYGASGGVGTFAVQIAKALGADVTAVCSTRNVNIARSLGADEVIDYKTEDFVKHSGRYDLIFGANGDQPISVYQRKLRPGGKFIHVGGSGSQLSRAMMKGMANKQISTFLQRPNTDDLVFMKKCIEDGEIKPVIDRKYRLSDIRDAFAYFEEGHSQGKVIITM